MFTSIPEWGGLPVSSEKGSLLRAALSGARDGIERQVCVQYSRMRHWPYSFDLQFLMSSELSL